MKQTIEAIKAEILLSEYFDCPERVERPEPAFQTYENREVGEWYLGLKPLPEVVTMDIIGLYSVPGSWHSFEPASEIRDKVHQFLKNLACLLGEDPQSVRRLVKPRQKTKLPGIAARHLKSSIRIDFESKTFEKILRLCGVTRH